MHHINIFVCSFCQRLPVPVVWGNKSERATPDYMPSLAACNLTHTPVCSLISKFIPWHGLEKLRLCTQTACLLPSTVTANRSKAMITIKQEEPGPEQAGLIEVEESSRFLCYERSTMSVTINPDRQNRTVSSLVNRISTCSCLRENCKTNIKITYGSWFCGFAASRTRKGCIFWRKCTCSLLKRLKYLKQLNLRWKSKYRKWMEVKQQLKCFK